VAWLSGKNVGL